MPPAAALAIGAAVRADEAPAVAASEGVTATVLPATLEEVPWSGRGSASATTQTAATAASTDQQAGVVTIVSTLGYQGASSAGTGMILSAGGLVLTNNHVVEGATAIEVTDELTGRTYTATVLGTDASADVALLRLDGASGLTTITLDDDGDLADGAAVTAIGNAQGTGDLVAAAGTVTDTEQTMTASHRRRPAGRDAVRPHRVPGSRGLRRLRRAAARRRGRGDRHDHGRIDGHAGDRGLRDRHLGHARGRRADLVRRGDR